MELAGGWLVGEVATETDGSNRGGGSVIGGAVPMAGITRVQAADLARAHCAKYGRSARVLAIRSDDGEKAVFECIQPK